MSVINIYLNGSPLTSTKNIFLEKDPYIKTFKETNLLKRKLFLPQRCPTKNRFLNNPALKQKDYAPEKKKKKRIKSDYYYKGKSRTCRSISRSRSGSRSRDDQMLSMPVENLGFAFGSDNIDVMLQDVSNEAVSLPLHFRNATKILQDVPDGNVNFPMSFLNTTGIHQEKACGNFGSFTFGSSSVCKPPSEKTCRNLGAFTFGSSSVCKPLSASAFCRKAVFKKIPVVEKIISKMPVYNLEVIKLYEETECEFSYDSDHYSQSFFTNARNKKMQLLNVISMALLFCSNLKDEEDNYRITLQRSIDDVLLIEPEFILK